MWFGSLGREDPLEKGMTTHSSILAWESHAQMSLAGYSPWDHKESDTTEHARWLCRQRSESKQTKCVLFLLSRLLQNPQRTGPLWNRVGNCGWNAVYSSILEELICVGACLLAQDQFSPKYGHLDWG